MKHIIVRYKYIICLIFLLIFVVVPVVGQNREKDRLLKDFENQIIMMNNLIFNKKSNKKAISAASSEPPGPPGRPSRPGSGGGPGIRDAPGRKVQ